MWALIAAGDAAVLEGEEQLRLAVLEEGVLPGVDDLALEEKQVRHPGRVVPVEAPGQAQEAVAVFAAFDGHDFDAHAP